MVFINLNDLFSKFRNAAQANGAAGNTAGDPTGNFSRSGFNAGPKKPRKKLSKGKGIVVNLLAVLIIGFIYFYVTLPAINLHAPDFYFFVGMLCVLYCVCSLFLSGFGTNGQPQAIFQYIKSQCKIPALIIIALVVIYAAGTLISMPIFRAAAYRDLLTVGEGDFAAEVEEISYNEIPMLDEDSAQRLGDRQMGNLPDMVSQFEVSDDYTQINYQGRPVRVACLEYADLIKWFTNRSDGLPAYVLVDMATQEASVVRLNEGVKYSTSEPLNRNISRHLRFHYPTYMFSQPTFEIDEEGQPWWICPRVVKRIGLFGGTDINGAVLVNAVTGESQYYPAEDIPSWVDRVYLATLIMQQYDYYGTFVHGFINSIFGQRDVRVTTEGYNYIAMNDDVYMYTGVTSITSDSSNLGFLLSNQRTKETKYYPSPGATEQSAQVSAQGEVQDLKYTATFPLLLNIGGQPTYFMSLKDANQLVKQYAMVNVAQYNVVGVGNTVAECERAYLTRLSQEGVDVENSIPADTVSGTVEEIRSAVMDGNTVYFLRLAGSGLFYTISATENPQAVILNVGDQVTISFEPSEEQSSILSGSTLEIY